MEGEQSTTGGIQFLVVTLDSPLPLHFGEANIDFDFLLWRQFLLHLCLESTQEEWPQDSVQSIHKTLVLQLALVKPSIKILAERVTISVMPTMIAFNTHLMS